MRENPAFAVAAIGCHLLLGFVVFITNPRRPINRSFLLITVILGGWVLGIEFSFIDTDVHRVAWWIRICSALGALSPAAFAVLRSSIVLHRENWGTHMRRCLPWIVPALVFAAFCLSPYYLKSVNLVPSERSGEGLLLPKPVFSPAVGLHYAYLLISVCSVVFMMIRDQFRPPVTGVHRVELQFVWLCCMTIFVTSIISLALLLVLHGGYLTRHAVFLRLIIFDVIIAYGITSRGILQIRAVVRLTLSYLLLSLYAGIIYAIAWLLLRAGFLYGGIESSFWPSIIAGGLAAVLVNSLSTPFRRFARHILPTNDLDFERTFGHVRHLLQSVATLNELLADFSAVLGRAVGAPRVRVLLPSIHGFSEHEAAPDGVGLDAMPARGLCLPDDDPVVNALRGGVADIALEELARHASTMDQRVLLSRLRTLEADLIVPARYRGELSAIIVLSPRVGGRIYGGDGRSTLRLIAEQLGVAIVNAHLYTEAYRSQAYNRLLVEHLPCGVITTDPEGMVRVLNPEARRLLQVDETMAPSEIELPSSFYDLVKPTLQNHAESVPEEIVLRAGSRDQANLRVNCLPMEGEHGELLGAVLVLNDHTALERLQRAVRQADRLASIGTLASGMAHEIKNPLTALKTFTQLLPKRYNDAEFRHDFSGLAGSEIARIERIVNQLLAFARPAPLMIEQVNLHEIVGNAVKLVGPQASRHHVAVRSSLNADPDYIAADKDRLQQVLLNLLLNAIQANTDGGWIEVSSEVEPVTPEQDAFIRLDVRDGGSGIPADILPHIFDPFFTTKGEGTGLGLSVSYNIVAEHKGRRKCRARPEKELVFLCICRFARRPSGKSPEKRRGRAEVFGQASPYRGAASLGCEERRTCMNPTLSPTRPLSILHSEDADLRQRIAKVLQDRAYVCHAPDAFRLEELLAGTEALLLFVDLRSPGTLELIHRLGRMHPQAVIVALGFPNSDPFMAARDAGVYRVEDVNAARQTLADLVDRALERVGWMQETQMLRDEVARLRAMQQQGGALRGGGGRNVLSLQHLVKATQGLDRLEELFDKIVDGVASAAWSRAWDFFTARREKRTIACRRVAAVWKTPTRWSSTTGTRLCAGCSVTRGSSPGLLSTTLPIPPNARCCAARSIFSARRLSSR